MARRRSRLIFSWLALALSAVTGCGVHYQDLSQAPLPQSQTVFLASLGRECSGGVGCAGHAYDPVYHRGAGHRLHTQRHGLYTNEISGQHVRIIY
jgi:hypothetical protein